jgi:hypothetical protein
VRQETINKLIASMNTEAAAAIEYGRELAETTLDHSPDYKFLTQLWKDAVYFEDEGEDRYGAFTPTIIRQFRDMEGSVMEGWRERVIEIMEYICTHELVETE